MVIAIFFIGLVAIILCFLICRFPDLEDTKDRIFVFFICNFLVVIRLAILAVAYYISITAIEAYRGNTTLEITYKDGIPVDSVVVYK